MAATPFDVDLDTIRRRHHGPWPQADLSGGQRRPVVQGVDLVRGKSLEQALFHHRLAARKAFLAGLKDEIYPAVEAARA